MDGTMSGTLSWWGRRGNRVGAHLCIGKSGTVVQTADLDQVCYHVPGGNTYWVGIEHEGWGGQSKATWLARRKQRVVSANRTAWICYHYGLGQPTWGRNIRKHSDFGTTHPHCPGRNFPKALYQAAARRAYRNLVKSKGRSWSR
jgi:N-acetyl-anhydromuramyl-L-alanine amidase AmpD